MRHCVFWQITATEVSEKLAAAASKFLENICKDMPDYMASRPRRL
jgi:hypothetical protein